jgi:hypothetical protein
MRKKSNEDCFDSIGPLANIPEHQSKRISTIDRLIDDSLADTIFRGINIDSAAVIVAYSVHGRNTVDVGKIAFFTL